MGEFKLIQEITRLSHNKENWDITKKEWELINISFASSPHTCICGHSPIIELCDLKNKINKNITTVGNCCVKKFLGLPSDTIFQALKRVKKDNNKSLNPEAIEFSFQKNWINEWEYKFYLDTLRKRKPTDKQLEKRKQINNKVLRYIAILK